MTEAEARARVIRSMCPARVCRTCGEPSRRIVDATRYVAGEIVTTDFVTAKGETRLNQHGRKESKARPGANGQNTFTDRITLGWTDCGHDSWRPGVVLDPFQGSK